MHNSFEMEMSVIISRCGSFKVSIIVHGSRDLSYTVLVSF